MARRLAPGLVFAALLALPPTAGAVLSGENGRIVFVSGRSAGDGQAQLYLLPVPSSTGGGTLSPAITSGTVQHRHPTWSPDRTRVAYAAGNAGDFDIFVLDLTTPGAPPVNITQTAGVTDDRPAWSPDGTKIAFESEFTDLSNQRDVLIDSTPLTPGGATNFTNTTTAGNFEGKPAWSPDSTTLYYEKGDVATQDTDIFKRALNSMTGTPAVANSTLDEYQPSISPDGTKVCFTISNNFNGMAEVMVAPLTENPSGGTVVSISAGDDYNCTWSPDGQFIAYAEGTTSTARLVMVRADDTSPFPIELAQDPGSDNFDGNPDWAPDGRPECPDTPISTTANTPVTFTIECVDTGPQYERTTVREFADTQPINGTLTQGVAGDPFTYTPNPNFTGNDTFQVQSFDELGFGTDRGTVSITVRPRVEPPPPPPPPPGPKCAGRTATIAGNAAGNRLVGTTGNDVIVGLGGNDVIDGRGGRDLICGGGGSDRIRGGLGSDRIFGGRGNDRIGGDSGNDRLAGDSGNDRVSGNSGNDRVSGGSGRDRLNGGSGRDRLNGGSSRDVCNGAGGRDRASRCERRSRIP